jgi:DNA-directed RNA polymerase specialized sigma24 family protein
MSNDERRAVAQSVVEEAFKRLTRSHRQLLLWHKVDELTYEEMAARLGISREILIRKMADMILAWCHAVEDIEAESVAMNGK